MDTRRAYPRFAIASLLGNVAFLASWGVLLSRPSGWLVAGPILLALFVILRVGGMWLYARQQTEGSPRIRRAALFTTLLAFVGVGLWVLTAVRGPTISF
ncbi:hypothetical protein FJV41_39840 [Myxococcus llanfairpwllgwyngyllgogerychwyrndrobwllllantysiliogogogochensis]|uniref:Uncharacterized protein n=1 Tax=Myxococcus llanfairpwllgwyngyllgogerychwyrndrobwllllantysiliogogogochensis TaxID=2590453 RepID=A0A540WMY6_9BACT|nr:hypothetical protein [Myxococcus llanfairpwllgwyngyllgogerychwyrndrobwllllantysiliogogogochensis]NTX10055.1 hypothetical protein [Myxococcus sp. CA056]TQF10371.1 hypothetical protein FJV41_39840 [Myxococcus llanfairpwllgwyngyllgogerychwyrndrobwllllantysiliogogogochensis]